MTKYKSQIRLTLLTLALLISDMALAAELSNENKYNRSSNFIGNADTASDVNSNFSFTLNTKANTSTKRQFTGDMQTIHIQQMEERRRLLQKDQLEAYKRHMQNRNQQSSVNENLPPDAQARREEYIKQMNTRRELMDKMMHERRKAAEEKRQVMLQKMHQTSTTAATEGKT